MLFGFAAYQVWGTGIQEAQAQSKLEAEFDAAFGDKAAPSATTAAPATTTTTAAAAATTVVEDPTVASTQAPPVTEPPAVEPPPTTIADPQLALLADAQEGDPVAIIEIPSLGVRKIVVSGVQVSSLRKGPGHYRNTALPGQRGNFAIAGHRTAYGSPFKEVDKLNPGDEIIVTNALKERYVYRVSGTKIVEPSQTDVLSPTEEPLLTITSCHPLYTANQRIIVLASLDEAASGPVREATPLTTKSDLLPLDTPVDPAVTSVPASTGDTVSDNTIAGEPTPTVPTAVDPEGPSTTDDSTAGLTEDPEAIDAFALGWFSDPRAWDHIAAWGAVVSIIAFGAWQLSRKVGRNLVGALVGLVPFLLALYFFYENVNRLLPPTI